MKRVLLVISIAIIAICGSALFSRQNGLRREVTDLALTVNELSDKLELIKNQRARFSSTISTPAIATEDEAIIRQQSLDSSAEGDDPFTGSNTAAVTVMLFNDYECPRCNAYGRILRESLAQDFTPDEVKLIYRDLPLDQHRWSKRAAAVANCIGEQGRYWDGFDQITKLAELSDSSLSTIPALVGGLNDDALRACVSSGRYDAEIEADAADARTLGAKGAPGTFVAVRSPNGGYTGDFIRGAQPYELIREEVLIALEKSGTNSTDKK